MQFLRDGHVVYAARGYYSSYEKDYYKDGGHAILIHGYITIDSTTWFLIRDPLPVNEGTSLIYSYEHIYDGSTYIGMNDEKISSSSITEAFYWEYSIVFQTEYADNEIPFYFTPEDGWQEITK